MYTSLINRCKGILSRLLWSGNWTYLPNECWVHWNRVSTAELSLQYSIQLLFLQTLWRCRSEMPRYTKISKQSPKQDYCLLSLVLLCGTLGPCQHGSVRVVSSRYTYTTITSQGNVELCINGRWRTMCANSWDNRDASVVCRETGYSPFGNLFYTVTICSLHLIKLCFTRIHLLRNYTL